jgi:stage II sporulation protein AA (anti-sigma F factor antagonist)
MESVYEAEGSSLVIHIPAELDHPVSDRIRRESDQIMRKKYIRTIIFDFSETVFMDSSGIGLIMGRYRALGMKNGCIRAIHTGSHIEKLLRLSGVHKFMEICRDEVPLAKPE